MNIIEDFLNLGYLFTPRNISPLLFLTFSIFLNSSMIFTWHPSLGTNPVCPLSILLLRYSYNLGRNLISKNLYSGDSTIIGLKSVSPGISGHTLFKGTSLAIVTSCN